MADVTRSTQQGIMLASDTSSALVDGIACLLSQRQTGCRCALAELWVVFAQHYADAAIRHARCVRRLKKTSAE